MVNELGIVPISQSSLQAFAKDSVKVLSGTVAEFVTPGNTAGFGTERYLRPSSDPINGIAFLDQSSPNDEFRDFSDKVEGGRFAVGIRSFAFESRMYAGGPRLLRSVKISIVGLPDLRNERISRQ